MSWITIATLGFYVGLTIYLVLGVGWPFWEAGLTMIGLGLIIAGAILLPVLFLSRKNAEVFKKAFSESWKRDCLGLLDLLLFRRK